MHSQQHIVAKFDLISTKPNEITERWSQLKHRFIHLLTVAASPSLHNAALESD